MKVEKQNLEKQLPDKAAELDKSFREKVAEKAREQKELAQQMEKLLQEMREEKKEQEKLGNKDNAKKLEEAIQNAEQPKAEPKPMKEEVKKDPPVNAQMKEAADKLKNKSEAPQQGAASRKDIVQELEQAMPGRWKARTRTTPSSKFRTARTRRRKSTRKSARCKSCATPSKKADMIEDEKERLKAKQEIAKDHERVMEEIEKTRRELARLQEQRAANDLNEANDKIDKGRQKVENGENADPDLKQAQEDLKQAKEELKEAEEQLARELLIKMADQLKQLKERQDTLIQRLRGFPRQDHRAEIVAHAVIWTPSRATSTLKKASPTRPTASRTSSRRRRSSTACSSSAKKSMDDAREVMKNRKDEGADRRYLEKGDGELMGAKELNEENEYHADTLKHQKQAARRLDIMLESLKDEIAKQKKGRRRTIPSKGEGEPKDEGKGKEGGHASPGRHSPEGPAQGAQGRADRSERTDQRILRTRPRFD